MRPDRRKFIKNTLCAALGGASAYSALGNLQLLQAATRASNYAFSDYKALICVFLYGGNDGFNTVVPYTTSAFNAFYGSGGVRKDLALTQAALHPLSAPASGAGSPGDGNQYALHPNMPELATLFNAALSPVAIVANVGTLLYPVNQLQYQNGSVAVPPQLLSHNDQQAQWQTSRPDDASANGWGGRIADLLPSVNGGQVPTYVLVTDRASWGDMEPPEKKLDDAVKEAYGDTGAVDQLRRSCSRIVSEMSVFRADLSYVPK